MQQRREGDPHAVRNAALLAYYRDPIGFLAKLPDERPGACPITSTSADPTFVYDAIDVAPILNNQSGFLRAGAVESNDHTHPVVRAVSYGLLSMNGNEHAMHRSLMLAFFRDRAQTAHFASTASEKLRLATAEWKMGDIVDIDSTMRFVSFSTLCHVALGVTASSDIASLAQVLEDWIAYNLDPDNRLANKHCHVPEQAEHLSQRIVDTVDELILGIPNERIPTPVRRLLDQRAKGEIDGNALYGQVVTLLTAGWETTSSALTWGCLLLAHHPDVAAELTEEVGAVQQDGAVLERMPLLDGTVKETLRLCSPAIAVKRIAVGEQRIRDMTVPPGSEVICAQYVCHRDPAIFPDPLRFIPRRWAECKPGPADYFPFGLGWRRCIGDQLATVELKVIIANLVRRFALTVLPGTRVDRHVRLALSPRDGLRMRLAPSGHWDCSITAEGNWRQMVDLPLSPS